MKNILIACMLLSVMACRKHISESKLGHMNGYWEIEKVVQKTGKEKSYGMNPTIDYLFLEPDVQSGYRKKVQPQINGTYLTSDDAIRFRIERNNKGRIELIYNSEVDRWREVLIELGSDRLILEDESGTRFFYRRHESFLPVFDPAE